MTKIIAITAVVTHVLFLATLAQRSAKFVRMQASPFQSSTSAQSTSAAIECAFIALNENSRVARPAGSFGYCETSNSTEVNTTEIAFKMTTLYTKVSLILLKQPSLMSFRKKVLRQIYFNFKI